MRRAKTIKSNNVQLSTYLSWKIDDFFDVKIENRQIVNKIYQG